MNATTVDARTTGPSLRADQCDRCNARARWRIALKSGGQLVFCEHHTHRYRPALELIALRFEHDTQPL